MPRRPICGEITRRDALALMAVGAGAAHGVCGCATPTGDTQTRSISEPLPHDPALHAADPRGPSPIVTLRRSEERGHANHGWLDSRHSFSFADYHDPRHMGFRALRVINEDFIAASRGFPTHPHRDMEIVTIVLSGALAHKDSMNNGSTIRPGEVQRMSAGTGITHSEFNASAGELVHLLQIWLLPSQKRLTPSYEQAVVANDDKRGRLRLVAAPAGAGGSVAIHTDARIFAGLFEQGERARHELASGRHAWVQVARGEVAVNGHRLRHGDALAISHDAAVEFEGAANSEVILFDLA